MKLKGALIGVAAGAIICVLGILDLRHVREAWEHTTFHPDYEMNGAASLILLGLGTMVAFGIAGLVGRFRRRVQQ
jgi:hypothetical protein